MAPADPPVVAGGRGPIARAPIEPGSTIGVLGGGQLGRMLAAAARSMGYRIIALDPSPHAPIAPIADELIVAPFDDLDAATRLGRLSDVVTAEFENVPAASAEAAERSAPVRPSPAVLAVAQHRGREKATLQAAGISVTPFAWLHEPSDLDAAVERLGRPAVLKSARSGYDGKGQVRISSSDDPHAAWARLGGVEAVYERHVFHRAELSVLVARSPGGDIAVHRPTLNVHRRHVLDVSVSPTGLDPTIETRAMEIGRAAAETLDVVGLLCVELFLTLEHDLLVNEIAPRPHNSGHLTIEAAATSQFEQCVRAVCGLPLGPTDPLAPAAMANLLGDLWSSGEPVWSRALAEPGVHLHLYGKTGPRPGRKMGHLTALASDGEAARAAVEAARAAAIAPAGAHPDRSSGG